MKVTLKPELLEKLPEIKVGFLIVHNIEIDQKHDEMAEKLKTAIKKVKEEYKERKVNELDELKKWALVCQKVNINILDHPVSIQAMLKRLIEEEKDIKSINPLVDLYNSISLKYMIPMGAYDLDKVEGDIYLGPANGTEAYHPLNKKKIEAADPGELIFADENEAMCRYWVHKQGSTHKVENYSKNLIFRVEGITKNDEEYEEIINLLEKEIHENFHPEKIEVHTLSKENPAFETQKPKPDEKEALIQKILNRGVADVIVKEDLEKKLREALKTGKKLRVKLGIDPTGADLHIGHMVVIKKLKEFQDLGHQVVLLFGNFTGQLGDPTGKIETRKNKTQQELEENAKHYLKQAGKILKTKDIEIVWNADWLSKLSFGDVLRLASSFTVAQMLDRDMFQERIKKNFPIGLQEFMYPLMQGYDSVAIKADVELGGTDQTFNLLAGRQIQEAYGHDPQNILTVPILEGLDGHIKMGKSTDNYIGVNEDPKEIYGKTMSIPDSLILRYFELATDVPLKEIEQIKHELEGDKNPRDIKMRLAREIVSYYHSKKDAQEAEEAFIKQFSEGQTPDDIPGFKFSELSSLKIIDILAETKLVSSKSDARRMIDSGAVKINGEKTDNIDEELKSEQDMVIQVGKRRFVKLLK